jgi:hypothetical protein
MDKMLESTVEGKCYRYCGVFEIIRKAVRRVQRRRGNLIVTLHTKAGEARLKSTAGILCEVITPDNLLEIT